MLSHHDDRVSGVGLHCFRNSLKKRITFVYFGMTFCPPVNQSHTYAFINNQNRTKTCCSHMKKDQKSLFKRQKMFVLTIQPKWTEKFRSKSTLTHVRLVALRVLKLKREGKSAPKEPRAKEVGGQGWGSLLVLLSSTLLNSPLLLSREGKAEQTPQTGIFIWACTSPSSQHGLRM